MFFLSSVHSFLCTDNLKILYHGAHLRNIINVLVISLTRLWDYVAFPVLPCLSFVFLLYRLTSPQYRLAGEAAAAVAAAGRERQTVLAFHIFSLTRRHHTASPHLKLINPFVSFPVLYFTPFRCFPHLYLRPSSPSPPTHLSPTCIHLAARGTSIAQVSVEPSRPINQ